MNNIEVELSKSYPQEKSSYIKNKNQQKFVVCFYLADWQRLKTFVEPVLTGS